MVIKVGPSPPADLAAFLQPYASLVSRGQSRHAMERYTTGLLADIPRKTAADLGRGVAGTNGQRLQEFLTNTEWDYREMDRLRMQYMVAQASLGRGLQIIDDTGFAKKGTHSVGVARQYSGTLGRVDNCQVMVTSHYVDGSFDWPIAARLYLPEGWTQDQVRLSAAKVPAGTSFKTKGEIALELIDAGIAAAVPTEAVLADAGYGDQPRFLDGLEIRGLPYLVGVASTTRFRLAQDVEEDSGEQPAPPYQGQGRPRRAAVWRTGYQVERPTLSWKSCSKTWQAITWREGTKGNLTKEFTRATVWSKSQTPPYCRLADRACRGSMSKYCFLGPGLPEPPGPSGPGPQPVGMIERFYQDAKGELVRLCRFWTCTGMWRSDAILPQYSPQPWPAAPDRLHWPQAVSIGHLGGGFSPLRVAKVYCRPYMKSSSSRSLKPPSERETVLEPHITK